ncbi:hypothetical protein BT93_E2801 [Corymbia citriodora subsp. variegata]|nr:hypothetical protein BT93_E2801 [Corymbia citriodora subsp. variegata]
MAIKVDLQCDRCYKKIQKILCEIPQVRDRRFLETQNIVMITVVCCSPEKVRQKICCKGGEIILGIDIIPPKQETEVKIPKPGKKGTSAQADQSPPPTSKGQPPPPVPPRPVPPRPVPPPPAPGYPAFNAMGGVYVCLPCHNQGCGRFCPCNCHYWRPSWPMCHDGCGKPAQECRCRRPPMCHDGCGKPVEECRCKRPSMCQDGCGKPAQECRCRRPPMCHDGCGKPAQECRCKRPPICQDGCGRPTQECRCRRQPMCQDGCGRPTQECRCRRPPKCHDGCERPAHECRSGRPSYRGCCDGCKRGSACSSQMPHGCGHEWPPVCNDPCYHQCDKSCLQM